MEYTIVKDGEVDKLENEKGEVAVIYSVSRGPGWSTYGKLTGRDGVFERMLFGPFLALAIIERNFQEARWVIQNEFQILSGPWSVEHFRIKWIEKGTKFIVSSSFGLETITTEDEIDFITA